MSKLYVDGEYARGFKYVNGDSSKNDILKDIDAYNNGDRSKTVTISTDNLDTNILLSIYRQDIFPLLGTEREIDGKTYIDFLNRWRGY